jgi:hypothetical protein
MLLFQEGVIELNPAALLMSLFILYFSYSYGFPAWFHPQETAKWARNYRKMYRGIPILEDIAGILNELPGLDIFWVRIFSLFGLIIGILLLFVGFYGPIDGYWALFQ